MSTLILAEVKLAILVILDWITDIPILGRLLIVGLGAYIVPLIIYISFCTYSSYDELKNDTSCDRLLHSGPNWLYFIVLANSCFLVYGLPGKWDGFLILLVAWTLGIIPAAIAYSKGRKFSAWYIYGHLMFILALPHALFLNTNEEGLIKGGSYKKCPHCAEIIKKEAKICKHCHKNIE